MQAKYQAGAIPLSHVVREMRIINDRNDELLSQFASTQEVQENELLFLGLIKPAANMVEPGSEKQAADEYEKSQLVKKAEKPTLIELMGLEFARARGQHQRFTELLVNNSVIAEALQFAHNGPEADQNTDRLVDARTIQQH